MKKVICKECKKLKEHKARGYCEKCYNKTQKTQIGCFGQQTSIYTNGVTKQLKPLIPKLKDKVIKDCLRNPRKYLD